MTFLPSAEILLAYSLACIVLFATPGPDMSLVLAKTVTGGRRAGLAAVLGTSTGCLVHTLLAAFGLSALIAASATAFAALKIVGAAYLLWLAVNAIRNGSVLTVRTDAAVQVSVRRTYMVGVGINLTNPKIVLFFVTFLPQFVEAGDPHAAGKLVFLGLYFLVVSMPLSVLIVLGAEQLIDTLKARPRIMRAIDYLFAGIFGLFALRIAFAQSR